MDANIKDEFGETCLFNVESVDFAKELLRLGVKIDSVSHDGQTAAGYLDDEDEAPQVAAYLRQVMTEQSSTSTVAATEQNGSPQDSFTPNANQTNGDATAMRPPPPLPKGLEVSIGTMQAHEVGDEPDPEFRRRIEALAARQDFEGEEGQRELRTLVEDAISGIDREGQGAASRRRLG